MKEAVVLRPYLLPDGETTRMLSLRPCLCHPKDRNGVLGGLCGSCNGAVVSTINLDEHIGYLK